MTQMAEATKQEETTAKEQDLLEALRESEERFRHFSAAAFEGIAIHDRGIILDANEAMARMFGYERDEFIGKNVLDFTAPESRDTLMQHIQASHEERYEATGLRKDGSTFIGEIRGKTIPYEGRTVRVTAIRDITDYKQAEEALQRSKVEWESTFDAMSDWVCLMDVETRTVQRTNRAGEVYLGTPLAEIVGQYCCQLVHGTPDPIPDCPLTKMLQTRRRESAETQLPDGRWVAIAVDPVMDAAGKLVSAVHVVRDITERRQVEKAMRESEEKFRLAFYTSPDSININRVDDGLYLNINEGFTAITGYTREDAIGKTSLEINIWDDPKDRERLVAGLRKNGYVNNLEAKFRMKDGRVVTGLMSAKVMMIGGVPHILSVTRDIEELKQAERALGRHAERLKTLHEIDRAILEAQSPEAIARATLRHIRHLVPCRRASVMVIDPELGEARILASHLNGETVLGKENRFPVENKTVEILRGREVRMVADILDLGQLSPEDHILLEEGIRSYLNVPLLAQGELIGTLNIGAEEPNAFDEEEIAIAREVAGPLAIAIQQARLYEEVKRRAARMASVVRVGQALGTTLDIAKLYEIAYEQISTLIDCPGFGLFTYDETTQLLHPLLVLGDGKPLDTGSLPPIPFEPGTGPQSRAIASRKPVIIPDIQAERERIKTYKNLQTERRKLAHSVLIVPLVIGEQVIGTLQVQSYQVNRYTVEDGELLSGIANQLALAIQNARLYAETRRKAEETAALLSTAQAIASLDIEHVLETVAAQVKALFQSDGSRIHLVEPDGEMLRCVVAQHQRAERALAYKIKLGEGLTGRVALRGEAEIVNNALANPHTMQMPGTPVEDEVLALAPLKIRDQVIGVLTVSRLGLDRPFTAEDLALLNAFANQATLAIRNARLYEEVQRHAEELEQRVAERTAELQTQLENIEQLNNALENMLEDLQQANRRTEETARQLAATNAELESFAYSVSHDLRAPLRAMQGFSEALLEDYGTRLDDTGRDYAGRIVNAAQRMDTLIEDLLDYSRLSRADVRLRPVSLDGALAEVLATLQAEIAKCGADVIVEAPLPGVLAHHSTLVQVLTNLLTNAIKFVEPGVQPHVRIWAEGLGSRGAGERFKIQNRQSKIQNRKAVRLWVEDNGIGIAPEHCERIFHVFERLHGIETYPGTGIGLAIVRKGVERMGGRTGVESEIGQGSRFWVELGGA